MSSRLITKERNSSQNALKSKAKWEVRKIREIWSSREVSANIIIFGDVREIDRQLRVKE
jgi:hypothetical protein